MPNTDWFRPIDLAVWLLAVAWLATLPLHSARAAGSASDQAAWQSECGSCHVAYPSRLLRPADWTLILGSLDRHYGVDASLDPSSLAGIRRVAGVTGTTAAPVTPAALPRITTSEWFRAEHREVSAAMWRSASVGSAANCDACHAAAGRGNFEHDSTHHED